MKKAETQEALCVCVFGEMVMVIDREGLISCWKLQETQLTSMNEYLPQIWHMYAP